MRCALLGGGGLRGEAGGRCAAATRNPWRLHRDKEAWELWCCNSNSRSSVPAWACSQALLRCDGYCLTGAAAQLGTASALVWCRAGLGWRGNHARCQAQARRRWNRSGRAMIGACSVCPATAVHVISYQVGPADAGTVPAYPLQKARISCRSHEGNRTRRPIAPMRIPDSTPPAHIHADLSRRALARAQLRLAD